MSKAYKCDRCGRYFDRQKLEKDQVVAAVIDQKGTNIKVEKRHWFTAEKYEIECEYVAGLVDLCPRCLFSFGDWFNGHQGEGEEEHDPIEVQKESIPSSTVSKCEIGEWRIL